MHGLLYDPRLGPRISASISNSSFEYYQQSSRVKYIYLNPPKNNNRSNSYGNHDRDGDNHHNDCRGPPLYRNKLFSTILDPDELATLQFFEGTISVTNCPVSLNH